MIRNSNHPEIRNSSSKKSGTKEIIKIKKNLRISFLGKNSFSKAKKESGKTGNLFIFEEKERVGHSPTIP